MTQMTALVSGSSCHLIIHAGKDSSKGHPATVNVKIGSRKVKMVYIDINQTIKSLHQNIN